MGEEDNKYKSYRIINGKAKWVIVDNEGKIINKEPNKEQLISIKIEKCLEKRRTENCDECGNKLVSGGARREYKNKMWTGRWLCDSCRYKLYYNEIYADVKKSKTHSRMNCLDPNSTKAKGDMFERLTCEWRGVKNLNLENDNFNFPTDHSRDPELGILQTKGKFYRGPFWYGKYRVDDETIKKVNYIWKRINPKQKI